MRSTARRSAGVGEIAPTAWISAFHEFRLWLSNPSILGRASRAFWSIAGTISHSVVAVQRPHPDSAFAGGRLRRGRPLFATAFQAQQSIGSPTRIDRGGSDLGGFVKKRSLLAEASARPGGALQHGALDHDAGVDVSPQRHEQLARQRDDHLLLLQLGRALGPLAVPARQRRVRLVDWPQPSQLDHRLAQAVIAHRDALFAIDRAAPPGRSRQSDESGELPAIVERAVERLRGYGFRAHAV